MAVLFAIISTGKHSIVSKTTTFYKSSKNQHPSNSKHANRTNRSGKILEQHRKILPEHSKYQSRPSLDLKYLIRKQIPHRCRYIRTLFERLASDKRRNREAHFSRLKFLITQVERSCSFDRSQVKNRAIEAQGLGRQNHFTTHKSRTTKATSAIRYKFNSFMGITF